MSRGPSKPRVMVRFSVRYVYTPRSHWTKLICVGMCVCNNHMYMYVHVCMCVHACVTGAYMCVHIMCVCGRVTYMQPNRKKEEGKVCLCEFATIPCPFTIFHGYSKIGWTQDYLHLCISTYHCAVSFPDPIPNFSCA